MRMTRFLPPCTSTRLICSRILSLLAMAADSQSSKLSEQSPPCSRKRSPRVASASWCLRFSISQLVTSGGRFASWLSALLERFGVRIDRLLGGGLALPGVGDQARAVAAGSALICFSLHFLQRPNSRIQPGM